MYTRSNDQEMIQCICALRGQSNGEFIRGCGLC